MNTELLLKVKAAILAEPLKFDMDWWFSEDPQSPCGTTACIAGHAISISRKWQKLRPGIKLNRWPGDVAQEVLKLSNPQCGTLFDAECWPHRFKDAYYGAETATARAEAAAKFIDYFIATYGQE